MRKSPLLRLRSATVNDGEEKGGDISIEFILQIEMDQYPNLIRCSANQSNEWYNDFCFDRSIII